MKTPLFATLNMLKASWSPEQWREYQEGWNAAEAAVAKDKRNDEASS